MLGIMLGLFFGVGMGYLHDFLDNAIKAPEDLDEVVKIPILGVIPRIADYNSDFVSLARHMLRFPKSAISEGFRAIRTSIHLTEIKKQGSRAMLVCSCEPNEGKTVFACNLAVSLAQDGKRTLLIDADLRRSSIHKAFYQARSPGLSEVLAGLESFDSAVINSLVDDQGKELKNLSLLCAGSRSHSPAELIGSSEMAALMEEAKNKYDMVVYDSGAALMVAETSILASHIGEIVIITRAGSSSRRKVSGLKKQLENLHCRIIGGVLNDFRPKRFRGYNYGYGYQYGNYQEEKGEAVS